MISKNFGFPRSRLEVFVIRDPFAASTTVATRHSDLIHDLTIRVAANDTDVDATIKSSVRTTANGVCGADGNKRVRGLLHEERPNTRATRCEQDPGVSVVEVLVPP